MPSTTTPDTIDIHAAFAGRRILLTGATGFVGKVWLALLIAEIEGWHHIDVLVRAPSDAAAQERWQRLVTEHPLFVHLRATLGDRRFDTAMRRVSPVRGDVTRPGFGLAEDARRTFRDETDLLVHSAGQVDFFPPVQEALASNTQAAIHAADLVQDARRAKLLHVSTCYVAGRVEGRHREVSVTVTHPTMRNTSPEDLLADVDDRLVLLRALFESPYGEQEWVKRAERAQARKGTPMPEHGTPAWTALQDAAWRKLCMTEGERQAREHGHPNPYTWSKALAEQAIESRLAPHRRCIFRPAIVESARSFPQPGWNEGFNTSGPLIELIGTAFRHLPARQDHPFDVVPVDDVCRAMTTSAAALLLERAPEVVQCATSDRNLFTIGRACELTSLGHRRESKGVRERWLRHLETLPVSPESALTPGAVANRLRTTAGRLQEVASRVDGAQPTDTLSSLASLLHKGADRLLAGGRALHRLNRLLSMYAPFLHETPQIFEAEALRSMEPDQPAFRFEPETIAWRPYWIEVHMPGVRRWCRPAHEAATPSVPRVEATEGAA